MPMLDQFQPFIHDFIDNIVDVKADDNCGYRAISTLLGMGENSWSLVRNHLLKELGKWSDDYIKLFGGTDRFKELRRSLLVDGLSMVIMDKWMNIIEMRYVIVSRYNIIFVSLSLQQSMTFFPLRSQPPTDFSVHRIICISHVYGCSTSEGACAGVADGATGTSGICGSTYVSSCVTGGCLAGSTGCAGVING
ncbi:hypothetical protein GmHk_16G046280 [Glycine max]|nr:hypothetical protein GmHk_16G046280 [Glycine max]